MPTPSLQNERGNNDRGNAATAPAGRPASASLVRALGFGGTVVVAALLVVWATGLLPAATRGYAFAGVGAALGAGVLALWLHGRFLDARATAPFAHDGQLLAGRLQGLLGAALAVKLAVVVLGVLYVQRILATAEPDVKFAATASFCVAFATASVVGQLATAGHLARALGRRNPAPVGAATGAPAEPPR